MVILCALAKININSGYLTGLTLNYNFETVHLLFIVLLHNPLECNEHIEKSINNSLFMKFRRWLNCGRNSSNLSDLNAKADPS